MFAHSRSELARARGRAPLGCREGGRESIPFVSPKAGVLTHVLELGVGGVEAQVANEQRGLAHTITL